MKLQLPTVTLICVDCLNTRLAIKVIEKCKEKCDFGDIKLLTSITTEYPHAVKIMPLHSLIAYSIFMLTRIHEYVNTPNIMIVQRDGWILNTESFDYSWLELDFIGGLYMQYDLVGSGGFSLRSKKIMEKAAEIMPKWDGTQKHADEIQSGLSYYEDGELTLSHKFNQFKFATLEQAANFSQAGNRNPIYFRERPFGFHRTHQVIDFDTGRVDSSDLTRDITSSYDAVIDNFNNNNNGW